MRPFKLWHAILGTAILVVVEAILIKNFPSATAWFVCIGAVISAVGNFIVATEVIENTHRLRKMMVLLGIVVIEFIIFFAFQYYFLGVFDPSSLPYPGLDVATMLLRSVMVFVFNPATVPVDTAGKWLLIIDTLASLGLVFFVLQNISQFRRREENQEKSVGK